jgi:hypothetical protein
MSEEFAAAFREALQGLERVRRQLLECAEALPEGDDSTPGHVGDKPALRAAIECTVTDRINPALVSLKEAARFLDATRRREGRPANGPDSAA